MSYFQEGDYVQFTFHNPEHLGYVEEVTTYHQKDGHRLESVKVRTVFGGYWIAPAPSITPISPSEEEIARRQLGEDYL